MRSLAKLGLSAVGLVLVASAAACAVAGEDTDSTAADFSHFHGPGDGHRPIGPIIADDDAGSEAGPPPAQTLDTDPDAAPPAPSDDDAAAPPVTIDDDAAAPPVEPPPADEDAGTPP